MNVISASIAPRAYGNFGRFLGRYVRDEKVISLAEGIRRLTSLPVQQLGLTGRGRLAANNLADVVVFYPAKITDHAMFASRIPESIFHIGKLSLANEESRANHFPYWKATE